MTSLYSGMTQDTQVLKCVFLCWFRSGLWYA